MIDNILATIDANLLAAPKEDIRYINSPFRELKKMGPKQKGKRYELITIDLLKKQNRKIQNPLSTDHDTIADGIKFEIKGSTLAEESTSFSFLQIRPSQDYDAILFSMFYPEEIVIMEMSKENVIKNIENNVFKKQHGGNKAESGTFCYYGNKESLAQIGAKEIIHV